MRLTPKAVGVILNRANSWVTARMKRHPELLTAAGVSTAIADNFPRYKCPAGGALALRRLEACLDGMKLDCVGDIGGPVPTHDKAAYGRGRK